MKMFSIAIAAAGMMFGSAAFAASFTASNAKLQGQTLTVDVTSPQSGWVVIHKSSDGSPGASIGHAAVKQGENNGVSIDLTAQPEEGDTYIAMLHEDDGTMGAYEFASDQKVDKPVMENGQAVTSEVTP